MLLVRNKKIVCELWKAIASRKTDFLLYGGFCCSASPVPFVGCWMGQRVDYGNDGLLAIRREDRRWTAGLCDSRMFACGLGSLRDYSQAEQQLVYVSNNTNVIAQTGEYTLKINKNKDWLINEGFSIKESYIGTELCYLVNPKSVDIKWSEDNLI